MPPGRDCREPVLQLVRRSSSRLARNGFQAIPRAQASSGEVKELHHEMRDLKEPPAKQVLENRLLKKSMIGGEA